MASRVMDLVRDIANPSEQDPFFPITRHKDWYTGHSWAQGLQFTQDAKNQESSSESVNTYYAVYLYGLTSGQKYVPNVGRLLLATEINSVRTYWHMTPQSNIYPPSFAKFGVVGILWSDKVDYATFFGLRTEYVHCIQMLPFTPISEEFLTSSWVSFEYQILQTALTSPTLQEQWRAYIYEDQAIIDKEGAWNDALTLTRTAFDNGNSRTNLYWWVATRPS
eukprot:TRINITY_DN4493_c0_g1_i16.p1 TRINITY_DN4493_c0_g1~~TRINITY_DN4493_c0_g1_i16.p1  ORF type:complete len:221 (-),score=38.05 TRINITY_DN4493_c0_g1_i16:68-730(-)